MVSNAFFKCMNRPTVILLFAHSFVKFSTKSVNANAVDLFDLKQY